MDGRSIPGPLSPRLRAPLSCSFRHFSKPSQSTALQLRELLPLPFRPRARGSQAGAGVGNRFGMLNIKQAKRGVSGPEATRAALQGSRESPRVYTAGLGWGGGRGAKRRMLSARSPRCLSVAAWAWVGYLFLGHFFYRLIGDAFPSSTISVPEHLQNVSFFSWEIRTDLSLSF